ncbi:MAG: cyclase [Chloroflexi bacterium 13_1_40CM_4_68_4]|nr:MAG: cyclase [Chloroflexi bacterium 13_1_40CM_4_68_4]
MAAIEKSLDVDVPVSVAYNQWTQFESFPEFMDGVKEVKQVDDTHLRWRADLGGKEKEWTAEITEQLPDERISWRSTGGAQNDGTVIFRALDGGRTRIILRLDYEPEGAVESAGSALGVVSGRVEGDLKRFKRFIESRGVPTGEWRGEVEGGTVQRGKAPRTGPNT